MSTHLIPNLYTHVQDTAASEWDIQHNLGGNGTTGMPIVDVFIDNNGDLEKVIAQVEIVDVNNIKVIFSNSHTGKAIIIV